MLFAALTKRRIRGKRDDKIQKPECKIVSLKSFVEKNNYLYSITIFIKTMKQHPHNPVCWFELPVIDMERAIGFYETVFGFRMSRQNRSMCADTQMVFFPEAPHTEGIFGALTQSPYMQPSTTGAMIYFCSTAGDIATELALAETAGGKIILPKTLISEQAGYMGILIDTEGNRIAVLSQK